MIIHTFKQYSDEWWQVRKGLPTASAANKLLTPTGAISTQSKSLISSFIAEALGYQERQEFYQSFWMERGHAMEEEARRFFTFETGLAVFEVGFVTNDDKTAGCSPDSLVPFEGVTLFDDMTADEWEIPVNMIGSGLELKCPKPSTHIGYLLEDALPKEYTNQVHFSMAVTGLRKWHFLSYHPELDPLHKLVEWDQRTDMMRTAIESFLGELKDARKQMGV